MSFSATTNLKDTWTGKYIRTTFGYSSPDIWIKDKAKGLLQKTRQFLPPIQPHPVFKLRRISPDIKYDPFLPCKAKLLSTNLGFEIHINDLLKYPVKKEQWRFTIAHEIGHTFFYDLEKTPPKRPPSIPFADSVEEYLCDIFASEFLMPTENICEEFKKYKRGKAASIQLAQFQNLIRMQKVFGVSIGALCLKVVKYLDLWNSLFFLCRWQPKFPYTYSKDSPSQEKRGKDATWRVVWSVIPTGFEKELFFPMPTKERPGRPRVHIKVLEGLYKEKVEDIAYEVNVPRSELWLGNLPKILQKIYGERTRYKVLIGKIPSPRRDKTNMDIFSSPSQSESDLDSHQSIDFLIGIPLENIKD